MVAHFIVGFLGLLSVATVSADVGDVPRRAPDPTAIVAPTPTGGYYVVSTGPGIPLWHSSDLVHWEALGSVFPNRVPAWAEAAVPGHRGVWAPDISYHDGWYYLYYAVSTMGGPRSVIGLAVNKAIRPGDPGYRWEDRGLVIESFPGQEKFNAIDPNLFVDKDGRWYLFFGSGSRRGGINIVPIDPATGKPFKDREVVSPVATRPPGSGNIEAPYVVHRNGFYYLFVSWDSCCKGADSNYKVMVGRSTGVSGPYVDAQGRRMLDGGGTLVLAGDERWIGPGHNSVLTTEKGEWLVYHTWDAQQINAGRILQVRPLYWTSDGWPMPGQPLNVEYRWAADFPWATKQR